VPDGCLDSLRVDRQADRPGIEIAGDRSAVRSDEEKDLLLVRVLGKPLRDRADDRIDPAIVEPRGHQRDVVAQRLVHLAVQVAGRVPPEEAAECCAGGNQQHRMQRGDPEAERAHQAKRGTVAPWSRQVRARAHWSVRSM
jgi:hypothetical protein